MWVLDNKESWAPKNWCFWTVVLKETLESPLDCKEIKVKVKVKLLSRVLLLATSWTAAYQAPPSMGFSRQEYWSEVPLPSLKEIKPVHPKVDQCWIFIGRTDAETETPILWSPDVKNWLIWKDPDAGKEWRWEEKGTTEDEMTGWHRRLDGHELE